MSNQYQEGEWEPNSNQNSSKELDEIIESIPGDWQVYYHAKKDLKQALEAYIAQQVHNARLGMKLGDEFAGADGKTYKLVSDESLAQQVSDAVIDELKRLDSEAKPVDIDMHGATYVKDGQTYVVFHHQIVARIEELEALKKEKD